MTNEFKSPVPGTLHAAVMAEVCSLAGKVQDVVTKLPGDIGSVKNHLVLAQCDLPTAYYLECKGFTKSDIGCDLIVAFMLDLRSGELDVRFSYGDDSGRHISDKKSFSFFDDMTPAIEMVRAHLSGL